jgi:putative tricarboxylic transport membrane protein
MQHRNFARLIRCVAIGIAALAALSLPAAHGQGILQPDKPVEIIVPTGAGGNNDKMARLIQKILQERKLVNSPVVVINKPGGNQSLGFVYLTQHTGSPNYFIYATPTVFTNELTGASPIRYSELTPLALLVVENTVLSVRNDSPVKTVHDLVTRLKADPESVSFAMPSRGGVPHLTLASAMKAAGVDSKRLKIVIFKTNGESLTALLGGHIDVIVSSVSSVLAQSKTGHVRMLVIAADKRMGGAAAHVPTFREQGINTNGVSAWRALIAPKGLSAAQIAFWDDAFAKVVESADWKKQLAENDLESGYLRSRDFAKYLDVEFNETRAAMTDLGLIR